MSALGAFLVLVYAVTWSAWFAASRVTAPVPSTFLLYLGTFAPGIVALGLTFRERGHEGVAALLRRLVDWEHPVRWYVFAFAYIAAIKLIVAAGLRVVTGSWPPFGTESVFLMIAATIFSTVIGGQAGEELGWRGYALPRLAEAFGLGGASIMLGVVWASWHLPFFFLPMADLYNQSFVLYLLQVTALSVAMAWLWANTRRSLLPVMLLHSAVNNTKDIVPSAEPAAASPWALSHSPVAWTTVALLWVCAGTFLYLMRTRKA